MLGAPRLTHDPRPAPLLVRSAECPPPHGRSRAMSGPPLPGEVAAAIGMVGGVPMDGYALVFRVRDLLDVDMSSPAGPNTRLAARRRRVRRPLRNLGAVDRRAEVYAELTHGLCSPGIGICARVRPRDGPINEGSLIANTVLHGSLRFYLARTQPRPLGPG